MTSGPSADTGYYYDPVGDTPPTSLSTSLNSPQCHSQWNDIQATLDPFFKPYPVHYLPSTPEARPYRVSKRELFQASHYIQGSLHDPALLYPSTTCLPRYPQGVNETVKATTGSLAQNFSSTPRHSGSTYSFDANEGALDNAPPIEFPPFGSDQTSTPIEMSGIYSLFETLRENSPAQSFSVPTSVVPETYSGRSSEDRDVFEQVDAPMPGNDDDTDGGLSSEPYAQLIYRALKSVPTNRMVLKDIYDWFEKNTDKAKNNPSKGWQNSIRHNLSMNGAFRKVEQSPPNEDGKKGYVWVLEPSALERGVESTTRYRKSGPNKKLGRMEPVAIQRQRSGAKGGKAARKLAKVRRTARHENPAKAEQVDEARRDLQPSSINLMYQNEQFPLDTELTDWAQFSCYYPTPASTAQSSVGDYTHSFEHLGSIGDIVPGINSEPLMYDDSEGGGLSNHAAYCEGAVFQGTCEFDELYPGNHD